MSRIRRGRSLWARSANYRRLAWTTGFLALIVLVALNRQAATPAAAPSPSATPAATATSTPTPAQNTAQYTPPPKTTPAPDTRSAEDRVAEAVRRAQQGGNSRGGSDVGVLKPLTDDTADNTANNTAAQTTILDPNSDRLEDYPAASRSWGDTLPQQTILDPNADLLDSYPAVSRTWGDTLHVSPAGSGFNVAYMTDGDLRRINPRINPYAPDSPGFQEHYNPDYYPSFESAADFWRKEPQRVIAREHVGTIKAKYSWDNFKNIPSEDFAAYWAGKIQIRQAGYYRFRMKLGWASARILVNRHRIYEGGKDLTPRVWLEPGSYTLEVEYLNNWHTTDFELALETAPAKESER